MAGQPVVLRYSYTRSREIARDSLREGGLWRGASPGWKSGAVPRRWPPSAMAANLHRRWHGVASGRRVSPPPRGWARG